MLANHLVTRVYPDRIALPLIRRWATELREDMAELFGYRVEITETTARLYPVHDRLEDARPARSVNDRVFDRRRYAYLSLALAALGRAGDQITLSELAEHVADYASRIDGLDLSTERAADRDAFVDAVGWLGARGALTLADGDAGGWASDPDAGEALYDIDRPVVFALFRPPRALQHLHSVRGLLAENAEPADLARRVRRALVERPVVYLADLTPEERALLSQERLIGEVEYCTGLRAERRAEGVALIDTSGRLSDTRFPGTGTLAQVGLLLIGEIADAVLDLDNPLPHRSPPDLDPGDELLEQLDSAIPEAGLFVPLVDETPESATDPDDDVVEEPDAYPFLEEAWVRATVTALTARYGATFAAQWQADVAGLTAEVLALLTKLRLIRPVADGLLVLPALARYRGAVVTVRVRKTEELFVTAADVGTGVGGS
nr:DUF2398 family protein [Nocardia caishijiensis]